MKLITLFLIVTIALFGQKKTKLNKMKLFYTDYERVQPITSDKGTEFSTDYYQLGGNFPKVYTFKDYKTVILHGIHYEKLNINLKNSKTYNGELENLQALKYNFTLVPPAIAENTKLIIRTSYGAFSNFRTLSAQ
ncbi:MAG: hypothetical protein OIF32_08865, partial [Campylobacterales bacterium]|nr:hypothetical protein [Campylobacterales bacterium]